MTGKPPLFIGIDVQCKRGLTFCCLDDEGRLSGSGWIPENKRDLPNLYGDIETLLTQRFQPLSEQWALFFGIDAPRQPLERPRTWCFNSRTGQWQRRTSSVKGWGRHCEIVIKTLHLGNPQWTPINREDSPPWMRLGYRIFEILIRLGQCHEVFPSATYRQINQSEAILPIPMGQLDRGPKDILDSTAAAWTLREWYQHRGQAVGGGDGLGRILLPRVLPDHPILHWPVARLT